MPASEKIVESGLHPQSSEQKVLDYADEIGMALVTLVRESVLKIKEAERQAIARLEEYVPTEPWMTAKQAAAYLQIPLRSLHLMTCPKNIELPFNWIANQKRFRKAQLDAHLLRNEVKRKETRL